MIKILIGYIKFLFLLFDTYVFSRIFSRSTLLLNMQNSDQDLHTLANINCIYISTLVSYLGFDLTRVYEMTVDRFLAHKSSTVNCLPTNDFKDGGLQCVINNIRKHSEQTLNLYEGLYERGDRKCRIITTVHMSITVFICRHIIECLNFTISTLNYQYKEGEPIKLKTDNLDALNIHLNELRRCENENNITEDISTNINIAVDFLQMLSKIVKLNGLYNLVLNLFLRNESKNILQTILINGEAVQISFENVLSNFESFRLTTVNQSVSLYTILVSANYDFLDNHINNILKKVRNHKSQSIIFEKLIEKKKHYMQDLKIAPYLLSICLSIVSKERLNEILPYIVYHKRKDGSFFSLIERIVKEKDQNITVCKLLKSELDREHIEDKNFNIDIITSFVCSRSSYSLYNNRSRKHVTIRSSNNIKTLYESSSVVTGIQNRLEEIEQHSRYLMDFIEALGNVYDKVLLDFEPTLIQNELLTSIEHIIQNLSDGSYSSICNAIGTDNTESTFRVTALKVSYGIFTVLPTFVLVTRLKFDDYFVYYNNESYHCVGNLIYLHYDGDYGCDDSFVTKGNIKENEMVANECLIHLNQMDTIVDDMKAIMKEEVIVDNDILNNKISMFGCLERERSDIMIKKHNMDKSVVRMVSQLQDVSHLKTLLIGDL